MPVLVKSGLDIKTCEPDAGDEQHDGLPANTHDLKGQHAEGNVNN